MKQNILQQEINEIKNVDFPAFKDVFNNNQNFTQGALNSI